LVGNVIASPSAEGRSNPPVTPELNYGLLRRYAPRNDGLINQMQTEPFEPLFNFFTGSGYYLSAAEGSEWPVFVPAFLLLLS